MDKDKILYFIQKHDKYINIDFWISFPVNRWCCL